MSLENYDYNSLGRLTGINYLDGGSVSYQYDNLGNRTSVVETPGSSTPPGPSTVAALPKRQNGDFNNNAMMVMLSNGRLVGWGDCTTGALANGVMAAVAAPPQYPQFDPNTTVPPFTATIVDWAFTNANLYVVYSNGWVYSAGKNDYGQLGHGDTTARAQLKRIEYFVINNLSIMKVWACGAHSTTNGGGCAYFQASNYSMYGCGANAAGNLGNASTPTTNVSTPAPCTGIGFTTNHVVDVEIACAATSFSTYMVFNDGSLFVAGYNGQGQLAVGNTTNVTGAFLSAKKAGGSDVTNAVSISASAGSTYGYGSALMVDSDGYAFATGYNAYGQLGLGDTTNRNLFTQVYGNGVLAVGTGGDWVGYSFLIYQNHTLYTWGYNVQNNLFLNNSTSPVKTPSASVLAGPLAVSRVFLPKGNVLGANAQMTALLESGQLVFAGVANAQAAIASTQYPGAYSLIPTPRQLLDGSETISDLFVHGSGTSQRWFILSSRGNLFTCGKNASSICTGGVASDAAAANVNWYQISFANF